MTACYESQGQYLASGEGERAEAVPGGGDGQVVGAATGVSGKNADTCVGPPPAAKGLPTNRTTESAPAIVSSTVTTANPGKFKGGEVKLQDHDVHCAGADQSQLTCTDLQHFLEDTFDSSASNLDSGNPEIKAAAAAAGSSNNFTSALTVRAASCAAPTAVSQESKIGLGKHEVTSLTSQGKGKPGEDVSTTSDYFISERSQTPGWSRDVTVVTAIDGDDNNRYFDDDNNTVSVTKNRSAPAKAGFSARLSPGQDRWLKEAVCDVSSTVVPASSASCGPTLTSTVVESVKTTTAAPADASTGNCPPCSLEQHNRNNSETKCSDIDSGGQSETSRNCAVFPDTLGRADNTVSISAPLKWESGDSEQEVFCTAGKSPYNKLSLKSQLHKPRTSGLGAWNNEQPILSHQRALSKLQPLPQQKQPEVSQQHSTLACPSHTNPSIKCSTADGVEGSNTLVGSNQREVDGQISVSGTTNGELIHIPNSPLSSFSQSVSFVPSTSSSTASLSYSLSAAGKAKTDKANREQINLDTANNEPYTGHNILAKTSSTSATNLSQGPVEKYPHSVTKPSNPAAKTSRLTDSHSQLSDFRRPSPGSNTSPVGNNVHSHSSENSTRHRWENANKYTSGLHCCSADSFGRHDSTTFKRDNRAFSPRHSVDSCIDLSGLSRGIAAHRDPLSRRRSPRRSLDRNHNPCFGACSLRLKTSKEQQHSSCNYGSLVATCDDKPLTRTGSGEEPEQEARVTNLGAGSDLFPGDAPFCHKEPVSDEGEYDVTSALLTSRDDDDLEHGRRLEDLDNEGNKDNEESEKIALVAKQASTCTKNPSEKNPHGRNHFSRLVRFYRKDLLRGKPSSDSSKNNHKKHSHYVTSSEAANLPRQQHSNGTTAKYSGTPVIHISTATSSPPALTVTSESSAAASAPSAPEQTTTVSKPSVSFISGLRRFSKEKTAFLRVDQSDSVSSLHSNIPEACRLASSAVPAESSAATTSEAGKTGRSIGTGDRKKLRVEFAVMEDGEKLTRGRGRYQGGVAGGGGGLGGGGGEVAGGIFSVKDDVENDVAMLGGSGARFRQPRVSLLGKPLNYKAHRRDMRYRRLQARIYNFLERPKSWGSWMYHLAVMGYENS